MSSPQRVTRLFAIAAILLFGSIAWAENTDESRTESTALLEKHCFDCHAGDEPEAGVRLDDLSQLEPEDQLSLLARAEEQVFFKRMPPTDAVPLTDVARRQLADWLAAKLNPHDASTLKDKLRRPEYGNYVDHNDLYSGEYASLPGFTYDRRWLISEYIFDAKFNRILNHRPHKTIDGQRQYVIGDNNRRVNLTNPFLLPSVSGIRYFANTPLNGGHLSTMLTNAKEAATQMMYLSTRDRRYVPAISELLKMERDHKRLLASRQALLDNFVDRLLEETFPDTHASLLPTFEPVEVADVDETQQIKKAPFHAAQPGNKELEVIFRTMRKHQRESQSDAELIRLCEQEWFYWGHNARTIRSRVTFLNGYMDEWKAQIIKHRYAQKHKPLEFRPANAEEEKIVRDSLRAHRAKGDRYNDVIRKCMAHWSSELHQSRTAAGPPTRELLERLVDELFVKIVERSPDKDELAQYTAIVQAYVDSLGRHSAVEKLIQTLILRSDFVYRSEFGHGEADSHGRRMMSPRDASYAIAYAITDSSPDQTLVAAAANGKLNSKEDYRREVIRLLKNRDQFYVIDEAVQRIQLTASVTNTPIRKLRFFREFFGYPLLLPIFKDNKRFGGNYDNAKGRLVGEADRLVDYILEKDQNVFESLLSTDEFYVFHSGDNEAMTKASERIRTIYDYFDGKGWQEFTVEDLAEHRDFLEVVKMRGVNAADLTPKGRRNPIREFKTAMTSFTLRLNRGQKGAAPYVSFPAHGPYNASTRTGLQLRSPEVAKFFNIKLDEWDYPGVQPAPVKHRKGVLTHPAWLIAHAGNTETDPVKRGKWVREKLLAGTVPDIPITVDAVIPEDHHKTLRQRLENKTRQEYCWNCHKKMNPLGLAFEMYDDFGRFRKAESLEHPDNLLKRGPIKAAVHVDLRDTYKTLPVDSRGYLDGTGDPTLDGEVSGAIELAERLTQSDRVRQSIIRHAFRYFLGRNEMLSDSKTLIEADKAYLESGGSFDAVIVSLLTSDSFIYRKSREESK